MARQKPQSDKPPAPEPRVGTSLGDLLKQRGLQASAPALEAPAPSAPKAATDPLDLASLGKVHLREERKGRGGKTVTLLGGLPLDRREAVAKALRESLGVGARVEEDAVVVQGSQADRVRAWLQARGARKIQQ